MEETARGSYSVGGKQIEWARQPAGDTTLDAALQMAIRSTYVILCWRESDTGPELVTWTVPGDLLDAFLTEHEGEIGTIIAVREVPNAGN